jgi:hypothetical protein
MGTLSWTHVVAALLASCIGVDKQDLLRSIPELEDDEAECGCETTSRVTSSSFCTATISAEYMKLIS